MQRRTILGTSSTRSIRFQEFFNIGVVYPCLPACIAGPPFSAVMKSLSQRWYSNTNFSHVTLCDSCCRQRSCIFVPFTFFKVSELTVDNAAKPNPSVDWPLNCLGIGHSAFTRISAQLSWLRVQGCRGARVKGGPLMPISRPPFK